MKQSENRGALWDYKVKTEVQNRDRLGYTPGVRVSLDPDFKIFNFYVFNKIFSEDFCYY